MRWLAAVLSIVCMLGSAGSAMANKRVAFVVGNGAYKNAYRLPNPPLDAKSMSAMLRSIGFEVVDGIDLTLGQMKERLLEFGKQTRGADVALFYYSGYGMALESTNYLLPVDADIKSDTDLKSGAAINVKTALDAAMNDAKVKLVFLDACRDNPFAARIKSNAPATRSVSVQSGLAEMRSGEGSLLAFATGPGQTALDGEDGKHSPFTRALLDNIAKPGVEIQQAMTQVRAQVKDETYQGQLPWGHTNLIGAVYLNPAPAPADDTPASAATQPPSSAAVSSSAASDAELEFWRSVKDSNNPEEFDAYLNSYPDGRFKSLAKARIAAIARKARAQEHPSEPNFPEFPWPPPAPSASYVFPDGLLERYHTLKEATDAIIAALESTGYVERSFFRTEPGGIALVTRLERIEADGTPARPGRWAAVDGSYASAKALADFLSGLFFVKKGHYRLIVFVIQEAPFVVSARKMVEPEARALIARGANVLPTETGKHAFAGNHCTALIYEFSSDGKTVDFMAESPLTGKQHLDKAGVLSLLGTPR